MAAGKGTRIGATDKPKVMFEVADKPIIGWAIEPLDQLKKEGIIDRIITVVGFYGDQVINYLGERSEYVWQEEQLGTGHAAKQAEKLIDGEDGLTVIVNGDHALYTKETFLKIINDSINKNLTLAFATVNSPTLFDDYGRVIRDDAGKVAGVIEKKDATDEQQKIEERNINLYVADNKWLFGALNKIKDNNVKKEYYLTDVIKIAVDEGLSVEGIAIDNKEEAIGINTEEDRLTTEKILKQKRKRFDPSGS
jgi:bifunctional UDP-N-acetylglucosamine pyrophosphorylase/glucosamine-1-phosphate N-acetyltransferase